MEEKLSELRKLHETKQRFEDENSKDSDFMVYVRELGNNNHVEEKTLELAKVLMADAQGKEAKEVEAMLRNSS